MGYVGLPLSDAFLLGRLSGDRLRPGRVPPGDPDPGRVLSEPFRRRARGGHARTGLPRDRRPGRPGPRRRGADLRADPDHLAQRPGPEPRGRGRRDPGRRAAPGPAGRAGVDHLPRRHRRGAQADPGALGPARRPRFRPGLFARARGSGQPRLHHRLDPQDRRRRQRGRTPRGLRALRRRHRHGAGQRHPHRRGGQADRERLPVRQHRPGQRAQGQLRRPGHRHLGGDPRRPDQAFRLHAVLPRPRRRRPLHSGGPLLPGLAGQGRRRER
jgi:hypothetical protein